MKIIGIAGLPRSGKDSLAELFIDYGYFGVSLGDIVRDEAHRRHASEPDPISVKNMTETSNYLRSVNGADFALKEAINRYQTAIKTGNYKGLVVYSVRAPVEADFIIKNDGQLIWVEATNDVRHERSISARRQGEPEQTLAEMLKQEKLQESPQPGLSANVQMNTVYVKQHATDIFENNGNDKQLFKQTAKDAFDLI